MMSRRNQYIIIWTVDLITVRALVSPHMALATGLHRLSLLPPSHNSTLGAPASLNLGPSLIMDFFFSKRRCTPAAAVRRCTLPFFVFVRILTHSGEEV